MTIAEEKGFPQYVAWIKAVCGGVHLLGGAYSDAIAESCEGLAENKMICSRLFRPTLSVDLADAYSRHGQVDEGGCC